MSDPFFDADRESGDYPPKGWGWLSESARFAYISKMERPLPKWAQMEWDVLFQKYGGVGSASSSSTTGK